MYTSGRQKPFRTLVRFAGAVRSVSLSLIPVLVLLACLWGQAAQAQANQPFLGEILLVPYNYAPTGWALCNGQLLPISQNTALFALLGTTYGGDGRTNFALPDLRGRVPVSSGQAPGLLNYVLGQIGGQEATTLTVAQLPSHTHAMTCDSTIASSDRPAGNIPARNAAAVPQYGTHANATTAQSAPTGGGQPFDNRQPYLVMNYIIAVQGVFPPHP